MKVELHAQRAVVLGEGGRLAQALSLALTENGARLHGQTSFAEADIIIHISRGAETGPVDDEASLPDAEAEQFLEVARASAGRARRIIHVISAAALVPVRGGARFSSQQSGLASLTQALAMELAPGCLVNALAVGAFEPSLGARQRFVSHSALRRAAEIPEIVAAALFLIDPRNTYTTGHVMCVDGGWSVGYARNF